MSTITNLWRALKIILTVILVLKKVFVYTTLLLVNVEQSAEQNTKVNG